MTGDYHFWKDCHGTQGVVAYFLSFVFPQEGLNISPEA